MDPNKLTCTLQQIKTLVDECLKDIGDAARPKRASKKPPAHSHVPEPPSIVFDKPLRPFIKQYANGMSGPEKFVLLLSRLVKGDLKKEISLEEVQRHWNKMTSKPLLDQDFNYFFPAQAKDNDWVETKKKGLYKLRPSWKDVFKG